MPVFIFFCHFMGLASGTGQTIGSFPELTVQGTVTDSVTGTALSGVSVQIKNSNIGTATNANGRFSMNVPDNAVLVVSHLRYGTQEINVNGRTSIDILLVPADPTSLSEVVVVGYGTEKKANITGSISTLSGAALQQSPAPDLSSSFAGRIPGVIANNRSGEPGEDFSTILIRGKGTLNDNSPLIVIDGVANRGDFGRINPDDVASITILKDASAAIYGAQAANGVILVTTKRGKSGKPTITYNGSYGLTQPTRLPKLVNSFEFVTYKNEVSDRLGIPHLYSDEEVANYKADNDRLNYPNTDWYHAIIKENSPLTKHSLSLSGGDQKVKYFVSGEYLYQDGIFRKSATNYNQYNLRANIDAEVTKNLNVSVNISGRIEDRKRSNFTSSTIFLRALGAYPTLPDYYPNGLPGPGVESGTNPVLMASGATGYNRKKDDFLQTNLSFELKLPSITNGLYISGLAAYDFHFNAEKNFYNNWDAYNYDKNTGEYTSLRNNEGPINLTESFRNYQLSTFNIKLGYDHLFGEHTVGAFVAFEESGGKDEGINAFRTNFLSDQADQISMGSTTGQSNGGSAFHSARMNIFGRATYNFKSKYLAEFILRRDGSYNFPKGKQWGTFPAASVGWRISKESFFKDNISFINELKLKASWGKLGNDKIPAYQYVLQYQSDAGYYFGQSDDRVVGLSPGVTPNPNVTWEVAETKDIGFESSWWDGKLNLNADYFFAQRSNILLPRNASIPTSTGLDNRLPSENIGKVNNQGFELELSHKQIINKNFSYSVGANYTYTKNTVVFMDEAANIPDMQKIQGHPMDSWLVYKTNGIYHNQEEIDKSVHLSNAAPGDIWYIDVNDDGKITSNDQVRIYESPTPLAIYGLTMGLNYKGLGLNILLQGQGKAKQLIIPQRVGDNVTVPLWMFKDRWTKDNPEGIYTASFDRNDPVNNRPSDFWLQNASFLRLKNVELSYTFSEKIISHVNLKYLRVYVNGSNLFVISKIKEYDPEFQAVTTNSSLNYVSGAYYPQTRIFNAGINISL